jgi:hypothetical protein
MYSLYFKLPFFGFGKKDITFAIWGSSFMVKVEKYSEIFIVVFTVVGLKSAPKKTKTASSNWKQSFPKATKQWIYIEGKR